MKELTITKEDCAAAIRDYAKGGLATKSCPIFQAAKRAGLNPMFVTYDDIICAGGIEFKLRAGKHITDLGTDQWHQAAGVTVTAEPSR